MADITNAEAIKFIDEHVRPLAESVRAVRAQAKDALTAWYSGIDKVIGSATTDKVEDGREKEGVSRLTAADVTNFVSMLATLTSTSSDAVIEKPTVRPLRAG